MDEVMYLIRVYKGKLEYKLYPTNSENSLTGLIRTVIASTPDFTEIRITKKVVRSLVQTNREVA